MILLNKLLAFTQQRPAPKSVSTGAHVKNKAKTAGLIQYKKYAMQQPLREVCKGESGVENTEGVKAITHSLEKDEPRKGNK